MSYSNLEIRDLRLRVQELEYQLTHLRNLIECHLRREPVIDREIYVFRNVQGFAQSYKTYR